MDEITIEIACDHLWVVVNDSFGHDWAGGGIQRSAFVECYHCGCAKEDGQ